MDSYSTVSRFYDLENADFTEDLPFWADLAREKGGPILELGCGSGRVLFHLAREGFDVCGIDSSPAMLAAARRRLARQPAIARRISLLEEDFTRLQIRGTFPLILLAFNTFSHLTDAEAIRAALEGIAARLAPGGWAVMALPNPIPLFGSPAEGLVLERTFRDEARNVTVEQFSSLRVDRIDQIGRITWLYDEIAADGAVRRTTAPMTLRYFFPNELELWLRGAGLAPAHVWGDYDRSAFEEDSPALIVAAGR
jgi:SAM-dependent methyltransferase